MKGLEKLIYLIHKKNDVNRKRRRFYRLMNQKYLSYREQAEYMVGYCKAQDEMKAMTPAIRELKRELGARIEWNAGGMQRSVRIGDKTIHYSSFQRISDMYETDCILLGERP